MKLMLTIMICMIILFWSAPVLSKAGDFESKPAMTIGLEIIKPDLVKNELIGFSTFAAFFEVSTRVGYGTHLVLDIPFVNMSYKSQSNFYDDGGFFTRASETKIGNPYFGIELEKPGGSSAIVSLGVRIPFSSDNNWSSSLIGELAAPEKIGTFWNDIVTISSAVDFSLSTSEKMSHRFSFGLTGLIPTPESYMDTELITTYGYQLGVKTIPIAIQLGLSGFLVVTAEGGSLNQISHNFMHLDIGRNQGSFRPELNFSLPLNAYYSKITDYTIGLNLKYIIDNN